MSNKALTWAWKQHHVKGHNKHVLVRLCDEAREPEFAIGRTPASTLEVADIAADCGIGKSTVLAALRWLSNEDLIEKYKRRGASEILINHPDAPHMHERASAEVEPTSETSEIQNSDLQISEVRPPDFRTLEPDVLSYTQLPKEPREIVRPLLATDRARDVAGQTDGRTISPTTDHDDEQTPGGGRVEAEELVGAAGLRAHLERIGLRPSQRRQLVAGVERALLRFDAGQVSIYLSQKVREAQTVKYLLTAFDEYVDDISQIPFRRDDYADDQAFLAAVAEAQAAEEWLAASPPQLDVDQCAVAPDSPQESPESPAGLPFSVPISPKSHAAAEDSAARQAARNWRNLNPKAS